MQKNKLHGWLVINQFLNANKFNELYEWFEKAGEKYNVKLTIKTNANLLVSDIEQLKDKEQVDFVLFWDKDIRLAQTLEYLGLPLFNNAKSIEMCDDKAYTFIELNRHHLPQPLTILAPKTYEAPGYNDLEFLQSVEEKLGYPMVVKECFGSFGWQVYMAHNREELESLLKDTSPKPILFQEFVASSYGKDVRLQVVGDQVVASMKRFSDSDDFRANLTIGGRMEPYSPTEKEKDIAIQCCKALDLDFGGVDLLFGENDTTLVCEVNSNAHFRNIYDCTGINVADHIIEHINRAMKERRDDV